MEKALLAFGGYLNNANDSCVYVGRKSGNKNKNFGTLQEVAFVINLSRFHDFRSSSHLPFSSAAAAIIIYKKKQQQNVQEFHIVWYHSSFFPLPFFKPKPNPPPQPPPQNHPPYTPSAPATATTPIHTTPLHSPTHHAIAYPATTTAHLPPLSAPK